MVVTFFIKKKKILKYYKKSLRKPEKSYAFLFENFLLEKESYIPDIFKKYYCVNYGTPHLLFFFDKLRIIFKSMWEVGNKQRNFDLKGNSLKKIVNYFNILFFMFKDVTPMMFSYWDFYSNFAKLFKFIKKSENNLNNIIVKNKNKRKIEYHWT